MGTHRVPIGFLPAFAIGGPLTRSGSGALAVVDQVPFQEPAHPAHVQWSAGAQGAWNGTSSLSKGHFAMLPPTMRL